MFARPYDWFYDCVITVLLSYGPISLSYGPISLSYGPILTSELTHIDLQIDLPHASYLCQSPDTVSVIIS